MFILKDEKGRTAIAALTGAPFSFSEAKYAQYAAKHLGRLHGKRYRVELAHD